MNLSCQLWKPNSGSENKIVFLHGMGGTGALWRPVASALEDDCEVLAPDQRGHGKSVISHVPGGRSEPTYTPLDYGKDVIETLQNLNFHPAWIVGHSMGVRTACAAAHLRPDWVRGLVLVDLGFSGEAGGGLGQELARFLRVLPMQFPDRASARAFMNENCPDPAIAQYLLAVATVARPGGPLSFPFDKSALIQTIGAARDSSVRDWVRELGTRGMPILVLRGEKSLVWSHEEFEAERARFATFPSLRFEEIPGAGHGLPFEQRPAFVQKLRELMGL